MPCYHPLPAWQLEGGSVVFAERGNVLRSLSLPCGQCIGCRLERSRQWAVRCVHESQLYDFNCFITLTYDDSHLPPNNSLNYRDFQLFLKRLRKIKPGLRFFVCGEYGESFGRPHFHACLFNCFFDDRSLLRRLPSGSTLYRSELLESLWTKGFSSVGDVTFESAAYVARYCLKKVTGPPSDAHYRRLDPETGELVSITPEFVHMSLKPGIGAGWFQRFRSDVYNDFGLDNITIRGVKMRPPRYYDKLLESASDFTSDYVEFLRHVRSQRFALDSTPERLAVREEIAKARVKLSFRSLK